MSDDTMKVREVYPRATVTPEQIEQIGRDKEAIGATDVLVSEGKEDGQEVWFLDYTLPPVPD